MKYNLLVIIVLIIFTSCQKRTSSNNTQSDKIDSLLATYRIEIQSDPIKIMSQIRTEQQSINDSFNYYRFNTILGIGYFMCNHIDSALMIDRGVIQFCNTETPHPDIIELKAKTYNDMGIFFQFSGQKDSALISLQKAASEFVRCNSRKSLPDVYINMADIYNHKGDYPDAANLYRHALFIADSLKLNEKLNPIYSGLAQVYTYLKNYKEADFYFNKVEVILDTLPAFDKYFFANSRGNYYYNTHEYEKGLSWFLRANKFAESFDQPSYKATAEVNLGEIYLLLNKPDSSKYYMDHAAQYFMSDNADEAGRYYLNGLYSAYFLKKNNLKKAKEYLSYSYDMPKIDPHYVYFNDKRLEEYYEKKGDYHEAYKLAKKASLYDDSLRNITIQNQVTEIDTRYRQDTTLLKQNIELANREQKVSQLRQTNIFILSLFTIFVLLVFIISIYRRRKRELQKTQQLATITRLRMESIRNRISPHFMFNILNSVIPSLRNYDDLTRPMQLLVESIRGNLLLTEKIAITLKEEIDIVKNYLALIESINTNHPVVKWTIDQEVDQEILVPSMIIQIPVENSIKYAFEGREANNILRLNILKRDNNLIIEVQDNGVGFNSGKTYRKGKGTGTGLNILYKTIEMLNVKNRQKMEFDIRNEMNISSDRHGTKVSIKIPTEYKYEL
ncbi:MAG: histidine kinase [Dysgonomonas sp.]